MPAKGMFSLGTCLDHEDIPPIKSDGEESQAVIFAWATRSSCVPGQIHRQPPDCQIRREQAMGVAETNSKAESQNPLPDYWGDLCIEKSAPPGGGVDQTRPRTPGVRLALLGPTPNRQVGRPTSPCSLWQQLDSFESCECDALDESPLGENEQDDEGKRYKH